MPRDAKSGGAQLILFKEVTILYKDLREWLEAIEVLGELKRIKAEVDWDEEMSGLAYVNGKRIGAPALLFENIKGYRQGYRALFGMFGSSTKRLAVSLGLDPGASLSEIIQGVRIKFKKRIPPVEVDRRAAPVNENIHLGEDVDLYEFPAPKFWPLDGGRYIGTACVVITRDPETGYLNLGTYRQMLLSKNEVGFYVSPGKDAKLHREKWWERGKPCEVAVAYGVDPLLFIVASQGFPKNVSEYEYAGGILGQGIEVVKGEVTDLLIPANAEIVVEGVCYPDKRREEGPFGEFTGYYGSPPAPSPVIDVKCVHHRHDPILTCALPADYPSSEVALLYAIVKSARILDDLDALGIPGIKGVYAYPAGASGFGIVAISIEQRYAGHASQVLALAAQCPGAAYYTKWIIVVDEDVDPTDINQVLWALSTRCNPADDIDVLRNTWSTYLDPTKNPPEDRPYGSKALINACKEHKYLAAFAKRSAIRKSTYERLSARWRELGMDGEVPKVTTFEGEKE